MYQEISRTKFGERSSLFLTVLLLSILVSGCVTSQRQQEMEQQTELKIQAAQAKMYADLQALRDELKKKEAALGSIRSSSEDANRRAQGARGDVEDLKRQLAMTQGSVDELQTKFARFIDAASKSNATQDVMLRLAEVESQQEKVLRLTYRNSLLLKENIEPVKGKTAAKHPSPEDLDKQMSLAISQKDFKKVNQVTSSVLASSRDENIRLMARRARGEAAFMQQNYEEAAINLGEFLDKGSKHSRYYLMLLLAGDSWLYLRNNAVARSYYTECQRLAPDREECKAAKERLDRLPGG